ncbi:MAG TPA: serine/threonine-protein kinase, partial [Pseudomonadales bacterium]|nr:serine/threonine-protein kinase [Pseudomonadales bacterium]
MATTLTRASTLKRWLFVPAPALATFVLLATAIMLVIKPRAESFLDYWYTLPSPSTAASAAQSLQHDHLQTILQYAWKAGLQAVALLLVLDVVLALVMPLLSRKPATSAGKPAAPSADQTMMRDTANGAIQFTHSGDAGKTLVYEFSPQDGDMGALYIGPNKRYRVERLLASGGMGSVHKGFDTVLQRPVAIKELDINLSGDQEQTGRFRQEALALAGLAHPYIVPVYDLLDDNQHFWIVMELLTGGDLEKRIAQNPPDIRTATRIIRAVAEGLAFAHNKGIVHRDIKPMNILLNEEGIPKLVDFGIAKLAQSQHSVVQTRDGLSLGSPTYMSPEQAAGKKDIDKRADIYALGITFYKVLAGEVPFTGDVSEVMAQHITQAPRSPR